MNMNPEQKRMHENLIKTFELIEVTKDLSIARIMQDNPAIDRKEAEALFRKEVRRVKNINAGIKES
jgi:hypothetical protein